MHGLKIFFSRFQELKSDPDTLFNSILKFYDIDPLQFNKPQFDLGNGAHHFRKGMTDEWRKVFSPRQVEKATAMIPEELSRQFDWRL